MNNKGFTLIELLVTLVIIAMIALLTLPSASRMVSENKETLYKEYESMMVEYVKAGKYNNTNGGVIDLHEDIDGLDKIKNDCENGYVEISFDDSGNKHYDAYIRCGYDLDTDSFEYSTAGYNPGAYLQ